MKRIFLLGLSVIIPGCQTTADKEANVASTTSLPVNCAHRGASGHAPENTLAAMRLAIEMCAEMSELDVQQSADDELMLFHDTSLTRTSTGTGDLWEATSADLAGLDAGSWFHSSFAGEPIPRLEDVIAEVRGKMRLNIEIKLHGREREIAALVVRKIREQAFENECIVTSFGHDVAREIKSLAPELQVGYIFDQTQFSKDVFTAPVDILSVHFTMINADFMRQARAGGKEVHVWTVNERSAMREMVKAGVDAIITNYPDRLAEVLSEFKTAGDADAEP